MRVWVVVVVMGLLTSCAATTATLPLPGGASPAPAAAADDIGSVMQFANRIRTLPEANRRALIREWESRAAASGMSADATLHLAIVLSYSDRLVPHALERARTLLTDYLADADEESGPLPRFARLQLGLLEDRERWRAAVDQLRDTRAALERERRTRKELEQKLEALKAIERRMSDKDGNDKVPLR